MLYRNRQNALGSASDRDSVLSFLNEIDAELSGWKLSQHAGPRIDMPGAQAVLQ
jgi:hypothetical protein